jgi:hypothetical protein
LREDHDVRREWNAVLGQLGTSSRHAHGYGAVFDAIRMLHCGQSSEALGRLAAERADVWKWMRWIWLHW